ncbi:MULTISPECIES: tail tape measure protein [Sphingomonas]|uniref:Tail tape measure protein n=1 Tax=Sphingomonas lycopersici TaxID=2951807 RepID=A0AA41ZHB4_9SPHN|nr:MULTISPECIES: tail tape measure protein [Sphingomonas]MCW6532301.1 tail tape measure protein [Sphingomonas lycopersici]MCW6536651.1 tail tape measure protein [Sphingomonas lycopersici]
MDEEIERLVIDVRADTTAFARDVAAMRGELEGPLAAGADRAGRAIERTLLRAVQSGKLGFEDLKKVALSVMAEIAASAIRGGLQQILGSGGSGGGGGGGLLGGLLALLGGAPGRATGGPVSPARPYWVGERGPELFIPTASGAIAPAGAAGAREVRVAITVNAAADTAPAALARSSRQVARAVKAALDEAGG